MDSSPPTRASGFAVVARALVVLLACFGAWVVVPSLALVQASGALYFLVYRWAWQRLLRDCVSPGRLFNCPPGAFAKGSALIIFTLGLELLFAVPWYWMVLVGTTRARWGKRLASADPPPGILQLGTQSGERRWCEVCRIWMPNRARHVGWIGRCLHVYEHTCEFFPGAIFLSSQKAYLLGLMFLPGHVVLTVVAGLSLVSERRTPQDYAYVALMGFAAIAMIFAGFALIWPLWKFIAVDNVRSAEEHGVWLSVSSTSGRTQRQVGPNPARRPWDCGWRENICMNMGPVREWLLLWRDPPIGRLLEQNQGWAQWVLDIRKELDEQEAALAELGPIMPTPPRTLRSSSQHRTSGFELAPVPLPRRRHTSSSEDV
ncbi:uncharacterized protein K452DRAFT_302805 [Aplosporella prunicola CBS 121167]|uniref:Palmitoyltransferase n=1 Tax=Aplosporella prunicola CBS 121167 TaxID=1176127 RepID=A0A6A6AZI0_9PEZI|nr:uncharacterized protein K452DRAFT_302805 [Aplosporella prunicola CBS 121167]KAF2136365.1 hypothetical protein K452DRAFT_302805 [Aplosporella prunicola CBS 121167]